MTAQAIRVGIIGTGFWAGYGHIPALRTLPEFEVVAVSASRSRQGDGACQPVNDVGKPRAGELHARFEVAGTGNGASATAPVPDPAK
ncbi:hypothetical protein OOK36_34640 [Streptomyces sp. NBC_00365]|uniref:hypothetical protein n=1 Tax=Streptomyces sp. NBC_00365 TaxID=2975726 RepID=UPI00224DF7EB|nr:hypothetical protein [Streptomyces sp. NBC_00365]MCX5093924.1 hypothetical protein [Streptomyces sp. NBC_00365]